MKINLTKYAAILFIVQSIAWALMAFLCILCRTNVIERHDTVGESFKDDLEDLFYVMFMEEHSASTDVALNSDVFLIFSSLILAESIIWCILSVCILYVKETRKGRYFKLKLSWNIVGMIVTAIDVCFMAMVAQDLNYYGGIYANNPQTLVYYMVVHGILMTIAARGFLLLGINIAIQLILLRNVFDDLSAASYD